MGEVCVTSIQGLVETNLYFAKTYGRVIGLVKLNCWFNHVWLSKYNNIYEFKLSFLKDLKFF